MSLIARYIESTGTPTLILGSALDILQAGRPPRATFLNYPLGFEAGRFADTDNQYQVLTTALGHFDNMDSPGIVDLGFDWPEGWQMIEDRDKSNSGQDQRSPRDTTPRFQTEEDRLLAESGSES